MDRSSSTSMIATPATFSVQLRRATTEFSGFFRARRAEILIFGIQKNGLVKSWLSGRPMRNEVRRRSWKEHSSVPQLPDQKDFLRMFGTSVRPQQSLRHACEDWTAFLHLVQTLSQRWTSSSVKLKFSTSAQTSSCLEDHATSLLAAGARLFAQPQ